jgi:two-component system sensor kinase FixL
VPISLRTRRHGIEAVGVGDRVTPTGANGEVWIHYAAPPPPRLSAARLLTQGDGEDLAVLAGSFVLIGPSAVGLAPSYSTTLGMKLPGVVIQAQVLDNLLAGATLVRPLYATAIEVILAVLLGLAIVWLQPRLGTRWFLVLLAAGAAGLCGGAWLAFEGRWLLDASFPLLACAVVAATMAGGGLLASRRAAMATLREREQRLRDLQEELSRVSRQSAMEHLSSALAHELNQPLTAIANYVQACRHLLAEAGATRGRPLELIDKATAQVQRASAIIDGLRDIVERGETARSVEDVNQVIKEAVDSELLVRAAQGVRLRMSLQPALPPVAINRIQIQQVLINLMRNALEAMEASAAPRELGIETGLRDGDVVVAVRDTGPGLAPEVEANLFKPFVSTKERGMGLGLSISRTIIQAHGGQIGAERNPAGGSIFWFTLPTGAPNAPSHPTEAQAAA